MINTYDHFNSKNDAFFSLSVKMTDHIGNTRLLCSFSCFVLGHEVRSKALIVRSAFSFRKEDYTNQF